MKKILLSVLLLGLIFPNIIHAGITTSYKGTAITRNNLYDYGPSVIKDGTRYRVWWCSSDPDEHGDAIWQSYGLSKTRWTNFSMAFTRTPNSEENNNEIYGHVCDPAVIKVNGKYYMYYTGASLSGVNNQIFLATSTNGTTWTKYPSNSNPQPVIKNINMDGKYGFGQPSVIYKDSQFILYYTDVHGEPQYTHELRSVSNDGINFSQGVKVFEGNNFVVTFIKPLNKYFAIDPQDEWSPLGLYYSFSDDGIVWNPDRKSDNFKLPVPLYRKSAHNGGFLTNPLGLVENDYVYFYYGSGDGIANWDIDVMRIYF